MLRNVIGKIYCNGFHLTVGKGKSVSILSLRPSLISSELYFIDCQAVC